MWPGQRLRWLSLIKTWRSGVSSRLPSRFFHTLRTMSREVTTKKMAVRSGPYGVGSVIHRSSSSGRWHAQALRQSYTSSVLCFSAMAHVGTEAVFYEQCTLLQRDGTRGHWGSLLRAVYFASARWHTRALRQSFTSSVLCFSAIAHVGTEAVFYEQCTLLQRDSTRGHWGSLLRAVYFASARWHTWALRQSFTSSVLCFSAMAHVGTEAVFYEQCTLLQRDSTRGHWGSLLRAVYFASARWHTWALRQSFTSSVLCFSAIAHVGTEAVLYEQCTLLQQSFTRRDGHFPIA